MATSNDLPPPPPAPTHRFSHHQQPQHWPQQQQPQPVSQPPPVQQRPGPPSRKSKSFRSDTKIDLHETSAEKEAKRLHSKADPTLAMNEAEPAEVARTVGTSLGSLRGMQHKDCWGNPIAEPDRSNPTRSRWERPLDTIRSFEAAIDGGYSNRRSIVRGDSESVAWNRRSSYYAGGNNNGARFSHDSYYGSRPPSMMYSSRGDGSQHDLRQGGGFAPRDSYSEQYNGYSQGPPNPGRRGFPRMSSEPQFAQSQRLHNPNEYPIPSNHRSYETVASASGSGSSGEPSGYQTDPTSSDNSSVDRVQVPPKPQQPVNDYGIGFSQSPSYQPSAFTVGLQAPNAAVNNTNGYPLNGGYQNYNAPPPVPQKEPGPILRKPTAMNQVQARPAAPEKRKSWFARRFSKNS